MRTIKLLGLTSLAALAVTAFVGVGSAAAATTLCKETSNPNPCPAGEKYPAGTEFKFSLRIGEAKIVTGGFTAKCQTSGGIFKTKEVEGAPLLGEITEFTLGSCAGCSNVVAIRLNYKLELERTTPGSGSLTAKSGGAGNPAFKLSGCPGGASCIYQAEGLAAFITGGTPAEFTFNNAPLTKETGSCSPEATFTATYHIPFVKEPGMMWAMNPSVWLEP